MPDEGLEDLCEDDFACDTAEEEVDFEDEGFLGLAGTNVGFGLAFGFIVYLLAVFDESKEYLLLLAFESASVSLFWPPAPTSAI